MEQKIHKKVKNIIEKIKDPKEIREKEDVPSYPLPPTIPPSKNKKHKREEE